MPTPIPNHPTGARRPRSDNVRTLCLCLGEAGAGDALRARLAGGIDWVGLAAAANHYLVAPALWRALERKRLLPAVPDDFRHYLAAIQDANAIRAETMRGQARRAAAALNEAGITPLILKGGARLFEETPETGCARMMADLDLLAAPEQQEAALAALAGLGYAVADAPSDQPRHSLTLRHPGEAAAIDLHRDIGPQRDFIPLADAFARAVPATGETCRIRLLSPTHRVMHLFFHAEIHDRGHLAGILPLRALEDFAAIVARHGPAIDWSVIARVTERLRLDAAWDAWLLLAERCLGTRTLQPQYPRRAALHYRRCLFQLDHDRLGAAVRLGLALTAPLAFTTIDYRYGCGASRLGLFAARARETLRLIGKYRHRVPQRLAAALRDTHEPAG
jgi:Uncharacterised nucleotidyltransferase